MKVLVDQSQSAGNSLSSYYNTDTFLDSVHNLDYSIVCPNIELNNALSNLKGRKIIYSNANKKHVDEILDRLEIADIFDEIFDIKLANYIPKPDIESYKKM